MLEYSVYERQLGSRVDEININRTSDVFKQSAINCVLLSLYDAVNGVSFNPFPPKGDEPYLVLLYECMAHSGGNTGDIKDPKLNLTDYFMSFNDERFIELLENASNVLYERGYDYSRFEKNINIIMRKNGVGFKCIKGSFYPSEEQKMFAEIIKPCFDILVDTGFKNADNLLKQSFQCYRDGDNKNAIHHSCMALDSVIDQIMDESSIQKPKSKNDYQAKINLIVEKGLISHYLFGEDVKCLYRLIHVPVSIRNDEPDVAHGSAISNETNDEIVSYVIDSVCSTILFIIRSYRARKYRSR